MKKTLKYIIPVVVIAAMACVARLNSHYIGKAEAAAGNTKVWTTYNDFYNNNGVTAATTLSQAMIADQSSPTSAILGKVTLQNQPIVKKIVVSDGMNSRVVVYNEDGTFAFGISSGKVWAQPAPVADPNSTNGSFNYAEAVSVGASGNIYTLSLYGYRIQIFDSAGGFLRGIGGGTTWTGAAPSSPSGTKNGYFGYSVGLGKDSSENIYVADRQNHLIQIFSSTGNFLRAIGGGTTWTGTLGGTPPITVPPSVADKSNGYFNNCTDVAVGVSGNMYVVDKTNHRIQIFDPSGNFVRGIGNGTTWTGVAPAPVLGNSNNGFFDTPSGVAIDDSENIYVSADRGRLQVFNSSGAFLRGIGNGTTWTGSLGDVSPGWGANTKNGSFSGLEGIAVDASRNIYTLDSYNAFGPSLRIQIFNSSGAFLRGIGGNITWTGTLGGQNAPASFGSSTASGCINIDAGTTMQDLDVDSSGNIYEADGEGHRIQIFDPSGNFIKGLWNGTVQGMVSANQHTRNGWFSLSSSSANAVSAVDNGYIYVTDFNNYRHQVFDSAGNFVYGIGSGTVWNTPALAPTVDGNYNASTSNYGFWSGGSIVGAKATTSGYFVSTEVSNARIHIYNASNGAFVRGIGTGTTWTGNAPNYNTTFNSKNGYFWSPYSAVMDSLGYIYTVEGNNGSQRIQIFDPLGGFIMGLANGTTWTGAVAATVPFTATADTWNGYFNNTVDIAVDSSDRIYVAEQSNNRITIFNSYSNASPLSFYRGLGGGTTWTGNLKDAAPSTPADITKNGYFNAPKGIAVDSSGYIYVVDANGGNWKSRVQIFNPASDPTAPCAFVRGIGGGTTWAGSLAAAGPDCAYGWANKYFNYPNGISAFTPSLTYYQPGQLGGAIAGNLGLRFDAEAGVGVGVKAKWNSLSWTFNAALVSGQAVRFKVRAADTTGGLDSATWYGPGGATTSGDWAGAGAWFGQQYGSSATSGTIPAAIGASRYFEIMVRLESDGTSTPTLNDVTLSYDTIDVPQTANMKQYLADGTTEVPSGGTSSGYTTTSIILKAQSISDATGGTNPKAEFEVKEYEPTPLSFTNSGSDGSVIASSASSVTVSSLTGGKTYKWQARIKDDEGRSSAWKELDAGVPSDPDFRSETTAPTASITAPSDGSYVTSTTPPTFTVSASDGTSGMSGGASGVQFQYKLSTDGSYTNIGSKVTGASPYSATWGAVTFANGSSYNLQAVVYDAAGNALTLSPVTVFCIPWLKVTRASGSGDVTAGNSVEVIVTACDSLNNVVVTYTGDKSLRFLGPSVSPNGTSPTVENVAVGATVTVHFTNGVSDANVATFKPYKAESFSLDVEDVNFTMINSAGAASYDLDLNVVDAFSSYSITATTPETLGTGWPETVTAKDAYGNIDNALAYWWTGWTKRKPITITGASAGVQTDCVVNVNITYDSDMKADFSDIRFTASDGTTVLQYQRASYITSVSALFFVKVPSIPATPGTVLIYMYYGNSSAQYDSSSTLSPPGQIMPDANTMALWHFDSNWQDSSANGRNGTASGSPIVVTTGQKVGLGCASFNPTTFDYLSIGSIGARPTQGTILFWMKTNIVENYRNTFCTNGLSNSNAGFRFEEVTGGTFSAVIGGVGGAGAAGYPLTSTLAINTWYHVAVVWDSSISKAWGYLNGSVATAGGSAGVAHSNWETNLSDVKIGIGFSQESYRYWSGYLDEVAVFNRALSAEEIAAYYNSVVLQPSVSFGAEGVASLGGALTLTSKVGAVSSSAKFYTDGNYTVENNVYTLSSSGVLPIYIKDLVSETITLTATDPGNITGTSGDIVINPMPVSYYTFSNYGATQVAGTGWSSTLTAYNAVDSVVLTDSTTVVTLSSNGNALFYANGSYTDGTGTSTRNYTLSNGVVTIYVKDIVAQSVTITGIDAATKTGSTSEITVNPGAATKVALTGTTDVIVQDYNVLTITSWDDFNNVSNVTADAVFNLTVTGTTTGKFHVSNGGAEITQVTITSGTNNKVFYYRDTTVGTPTVIADWASGGVNLGSANRGYIVNPAAPATMTFTTQPSSAAAGVNFVAQPVVKIYDVYNNLCINNSALSVTISAVLANDGTTAGTGTVGGTVTGTASAGVVTYTDLNYSKAENINLKATATGPSAALSSTVTVGPLPANLKQYLPDGTTLVPAAGYSTDSIILKAETLGSFPGTAVVEFEEKPQASSFDGTGLVDGSAISGGISGTTIPGPLSDGNYKWQARIKDVATGVNNGVAVGGATFDTTNQKISTGCGNFNGSGQYVSITSPSSLNYADVTVAMWIKPAITYQAGGGLYTTFFSLWKDDSHRWVFGYNRSAGNLYLYENPGYKVEYPITLTAGNWYYLVATTSSSGVAKVYINGSEIGSASGVAGWDASVWVAAVIASDWYASAPGSYFNGLVDEVKIYSKVLTTTEIIGIYNAEVGGGTVGSGIISGLVGRWGFDQNWNDFRDRYSNWVNPGSVPNFIVETVAPTASITAPSDGSYVTSATPPVFTVSASDGTSGMSGGASGVQFQYKLSTDGSYTNIGSKVTGASPYSATWGAVTFANGSSYNLQAVVYDAAGNIATVGPITVSCDDISPTITNVTSTTIDGTYKAGDTIAVKIDFSEPVKVASGVPSLSLNSGAGGTATYTTSSNLRGTGLLAYWRFEEGSGQYIEDKSDYFTTLWANYSPTWSIGGGRVGNTCILNGTTQFYNGFTACCYFVPHLQFAAGSSFTIAAWVAPTELRDAGIMFHSYGNTGYGLEIKNTGGQYRYVFYGSVADVTSNNATTVTADGSWHYIVGVQRGAENIRQLFVDGQIVGIGAAQDASGSGIPATSYGQFYIGIRSNGNTIFENYFKGKIDEARIYGRALSASEIQGIYTVEGGGTASTGATTSLNFNYVVQAGDTTSGLDLNYTATDSFVLNGGVLQDRAGINISSLTLPAVAGVNSLAGNKDIKIDTIPAIVASVISTTANGFYKIGVPIDATINFSEPVDFGTTAAGATLTLETGVIDRTATYSSTAGVGGSGLIGYWHFDEGSGTTSADASGNSYTATLVTQGAVNSTWTTGKIGNALEFNMPAAQVPTINRQRVSTVCPVDASEGTNGITMMVWAYPEYVTNGGHADNWSYDKYAVVSVSRSSDWGGWYLYAQYNGKWAISNAASNQFPSDFNVDLNQWQHVAIVCNPLATDGTWVYKNGVKNSVIIKGSDSKTAFDKSGGVRYITIGAMSNMNNVQYGDSYFQGKIDEVRVYNRVLSDAEIQAIYDAEVGGVAPRGPSTTLSLTYTVQAGDTSSDLDYVATNSFALSSGVLKDMAGNNVTLTLPAVGGANSIAGQKAIVVDTINPVVAVTVANPYYTVSDWVAASTINGTFSDASGLQATTGVQVSVMQDEATDHYWNGSDWTNTNEQWNNATSFDSGSSGNWTYTLVAANLTAGKTYVVTAKATDKATNQTTSSTDSFVYTPTLKVTRTTGNGDVTAGNSVGITITACDILDATVTAYAGSKSLTFFGPVASPGGNQPTVDAIAVGSATSVTFTNGVATATLIPYKTETFALDVQDANGTTINSNGDAAYDLDLTIVDKGAHHLKIRQLSDQNISSATVTAGDTVNLRVWIYDEYDNYAVSFCPGLGCGPYLKYSGPGIAPDGISIPKRGTDNIGSDTFTIFDYNYSGANWADLTVYKAETVSLDVELSTTPTINSSGNAAYDFDLVVNPKPLVAMYIAQQPSLTPVAGELFAQQPVIQLVDEYRNVRTGDSATQVTATAVKTCDTGTPGAGQLRQNTTNPAPAVTASGGIVTFSGLNYTFASYLECSGAGIKLKFASGSLANQLSSTMVVDQNVPDHYGWNNSPASSMQAGGNSTSLYLTQYDVRRYDVYNNPIPDAGAATPAVLSSNSTGNWKFTLTDNPAAEAVTTLTIPGGTSAATCYYYDDKVGAYTITASYGAITPVTASLTVNPASTYAYFLSAPGDIIAGTTLAQYTITRKDVFNNLVTSGAETVDLSVTVPHAQAQFRATQNGATITQISIPNGQSSVDFWYYDELMGAYTITSARSGIVSGTDVINVTHGAPDHLRFSGAITAPANIELQFDLPAIEAVDAWGNILTNAYSATPYVGSKTVTFSMSTGLVNAPNASATDKWLGVANPQATINFTNGTSTTPLNAQLYRAQTASIIASAKLSQGGDLPNSPTTPDIASNAIVFNPLAIGDYLEFYQQPSANGVINSALPQQPIVYIKDTYGNKINDNSKTVQVSDSSSSADPFQDAPGVLSSSDAGNIITVVSGSAVFSGVKYSEVGEIYLYAASAAITPAYSNKITLAAAATTTVESATVPAANLNITPTNDTEAEKFAVLKFRVQDAGGDSVPTLIDRIQIAVAGTGNNASTDIAWAELHDGTATVATSTSITNSTITFGLASNANSVADLDTVPDNSSIEYTVNIFMKPSKLIATEGDTYTFDTDETKISADGGLSSQVTTDTGKVAVVTGTIVVAVSHLVVMTTGDLTTISLDAGSSPSANIKVEAVDANKNIDENYTATHGLIFTGLGIASSGHQPKTATGKPFGTTHTLSFVVGVSDSVTLTAYKKETGTVTVSESNQSYLTHGLIATVSPAAASAISKSSGDTQSGAVGAVLAQPCRVLVADVYGNSVANYDVTFSAGGGNGVLTSPTVTVTDAQGLASTYLTLGSVAGAGVYSVTASSSLGSQVFTATALSASSIIVDSGNNPADKKVTEVCVPFVAKVVAAGNVPVPNVTVSFSITNKPGSTTGESLSAATAVTNASGLASTTLTIGDKMGVYTVRASYAGYYVDFTVSSGPQSPYKVVLSGPGSAEAGEVSGAYSLSIQDEYSNLSGVTTQSTFNLTNVASSSGTFYSDLGITPIPGNQIVLALNSSGTTFYYKDTVIQSLAIGVSLAGGQAGMNTVSASISPVTITPAGLEYFKITGSAADMDAGDSRAITIRAYDTEDNLKTDYTGNINVTFTGVTPATSATVSDKDSVDRNFGVNTLLSFSSGVASGTLKVYKAGTAMIKATVGSATTSDADALSFTVKHKNADHLKFTSDIPSPKVAGVPFNFETTIDAVDQYGNLCDGANGATVYNADSKTIIYSLSGASNGPAIGTDVFTNPVTFTSGRSITALSATLYRAQSTTITPSVVELIGTNTASNSITINAAAINTLRFSQQPSSTGITNVVWAQQPKVAVADQWGNAVTSTSAQITLSASLTSGSDTSVNGILSPANMLTQETSSGEATFIGLNYTYPEAIFLKASVAGVNLASIYSFQVSLSTQQDTSIVKVVQADSIISSLSTTVVDKEAVLGLRITDDGTDGYSTKIKQITINNTNVGTTANWTDFIAGAYLDNGSIETQAYSIANNKIIFGSGNSTLYTILNGGNATYTLKLVLKAPLPAGADNEPLAFSVGTGDISLDALGSKFKTGVTAVTDTTSIEVKATGFKVTSGSAQVNAGSTVTVALEARDVNGNKDEDYIGDRNIVFSGASVSLKNNTPIVTVGSTANFAASYGAATPDVVVPFAAGVNSSAIVLTLYKSEAANVRVYEAAGLYDVSLGTSDANALGLIVNGGSAYQLLWKTEPVAKVVANAPWQEFVIAVADAYGNTAPSASDITVNVSNGDLGANCTSVVTAVSGEAHFTNFTATATTYPKAISVTGTTPGIAVDTGDFGPITLEEKYNVSLIVKDSVTNSNLPEIILQVLQGNTVIYGPPKGNSPFTFALLYGSYSINLDKEKYVQYSKDVVLGVEGDAADGLHDANIAMTLYITSLEEATADYQVKSTFVYDEDNDKLISRLWMERRGKVVYNAADSTNKLGDATIQVFDDATDAWLNTLTIPHPAFNNYTTSTYRIDVADVTKAGGQIVLSAGKTYFAKCTISYGGSDGTGKLYETGATFTITVTKSLKVVTDQLSVMATDIQNQVTGVQGTITTQAGITQQSIVTQAGLTQKAVGDVMTEAQKIVTATVTTIPASLAAVNTAATDIRSQVTTAAKSEILNRENIVLLGTTINIRYRTYPTAAPVVSVYDPTNVLKVSSMPMMEVTPGIYQYAVSFGSSWPSGDYSIVCSEPNYGTMDAVTITAKTADIESIAGDVSAVLGSVTPVQDIKSKVDAFTTAFSVVEDNIRKATEAMAGAKIGTDEASKAADTMSAAFNNLKEMSAKIHELGATVGYDLEKLYEVNEARAKDIDYIRNKTQELKAMLLLSQQMMEGTAKEEPVVQTWFEFR